ncbi:MAG: hypothetical protein NVSMB1_19590 [Polyangiales bacterium]
MAGSWPLREESANEEGMMIIAIVAVLVLILGSDLLELVTARRSMSRRRPGFVISR